VVVGDAGSCFTYASLNEAFRVLISLPADKRSLISLGYGKYYNGTHGLMLDVGAFARALEFACDCKAEIIGKPNAQYFQGALESLDCNLKANETLMIGDDIVSDVEGAQKIGMRGVLVRTGKWRPEWENHATIKPDAIVNDLAEAVDAILKCGQTVN